MKFRAKMSEVFCMRTLSSIVSTISKLTKLCVLRLSKDYFYFIVLEESALPLRTSVWCMMQQAHFFNEYKLVGPPEDESEIYLELSPDLLASSLSSLRVNVSAAKTMKIKLTHKDTPRLTLEIELPTQTSQSRLCMHEVPVHVIPHRRWGDYAEPPTLDPDISIEMPNLKILRNITERLKKLHNYLNVVASSEGRLTLNVETSMASVSTHFRDLEVFKVNDTKPGPFITRVDVRKFSNFMTCEQVSPTRVICHMRDGASIHLRVEHSDMTLSFFLTGVDE
ncbi:checkpoint protein HUS1 [Homalodisca vitripennis]|nr:checkpoint protein HUS1 [Homalodisca vitripennis]